MAQLDFNHLLVVRSHGGARRNSGPKAAQPTVSHDRRATFSSRTPLHITLSAVDGIGLRRMSLPAIHDAIADEQLVRINQINIESNHLHLIAETKSRESLSHGLQGFKSGLARRLNAILGRSGPLFDDRYHARPLGTPMEVRNALRYVLNNARHHAADAGRVIEAAWFDPFSSAAWFTGWREPLVASTSAHARLLAMPAPTKSASTWLLAVGWRRHGLIGVDEIPGARRALRHLRTQQADLEEQRRLHAAFMAAG